MAQPLQVLPNIAKTEGSPINPPKHYGNRSCLSAGAPANPTQTQAWRKHAGIDGVMAQPSNLEIFQRFCMAASGNSIKKQRSKISISGLRDSWHRWCNQLWKRAWDVTEVSNSQMSAPSMRALSKWAEPFFSQSFRIKNSCVDGINPTYSPYLEILHFKHTFQLSISDLRDSWYTWRNQTWHTAVMSRGVLVSKYPKAGAIYTICPLSIWRGVIHFQYGVICMYVYIYI